MGMYDYFYKLFFKILNTFMKDTHEKTQEEKSLLMIDMEANLRNLKFTTLEIKEVTNIVHKAEYEIAELKSKLTGTNISDESPIPYQEFIMKKIQATTEKMNEDLRLKIDEIMARDPKRWPKE